MTPPPLHPPHPQTPTRTHPQVILLQLSLAPLRGQDTVRRLQAELASEGFDLDRWRRGGSGLAARCDFSALDESGGWEVAKRLLCRRRGRLRARDALRYPFFRRKLGGG